MKKLLAVFYALIFLTACSDNKGSEKILPPDKLFNLLIDIHLADASLDYTSNMDTMLMKAKSKYTYIFKKHHTDSATLTYNLNYYTQYKSKEFTKVYTQIIDSLERLREKFAKTTVPFSIPFENKCADSIYFDIKIPYKIDSALLKSRIKEEETVKDTLSNVVAPNNITDTLKDTLHRINRNKEWRLRKKVH